MEICRDCSAQVESLKEHSEVCDKKPFRCEYAGAYTTSTSERSDFRILTKIKEEVLSDAGPHDQRENER